MTGKDSSEIFSAPSCAQKFEILSQELNSAMETCFPWKSVKKHVSDKPWITNNIKLLSSIKGQMNQKFDIFYFSSILVKCVQDDPNKHTMKFQLNWSKRLRDIRN